MYTKVDHYKKKINAKKIIKDILFVYIIAVIFVLLFNSLFIQAFKIHSDSMKPQIKDNTWILVNKFIYGPKYPFTEKRIFNATNNIKRGDIIVFMSNEYINTSNFYRSLALLIYTLTFIELPNLLEDKKENIYIKRVIGIPGDNITYKKIDNKIEVFINGIYEDKIVEKNYELIDDDDPYPLLEEYTLNQDEYYVLGDNRKNSSDSRIWGSIKSKQIIGKAVYEYYPKFKSLK